MIFQIPIWVVISFVSLIVLAFIIGYFSLRKHYRKEKQEHKNLEKKF